MQINHQALNTKISTTDKILSTAIIAGVSAAEKIMDYYNNYKNIETKTKSCANDFVSAADLAANEIITNLIQKHFSNHGIYSEESEDRQIKDITWIIDPIDGTLNFLHGYPDFAVSIGIMEKQEIVYSVIVHPYTMDVYYAKKGEGAFLNSEPIFVSKAKNITESLISTEFPFYNKNEANLNNYWPKFKNILLNSHNILISGSTVLELAYLAAGKLDAYINITEGLHPWDIAAGILLITEAKGTVINDKGNNITNPINDRKMIAANSKDIGNSILSYL